MEYSFLKDEQSRQLKTKIFSDVVAQLFSLLVSSKYSKRILVMELIVVLKVVYLLRNAQDKYSYGCWSGQNILKSHPAIFLETQLYPLPQMIFIPADCLDYKYSGV